MVEPSRASTGAEALHRYFCGTDTTAVLSETSRGLCTAPEAAGQRLTHPYLVICQPLLLPLSRLEKEQEDRAKEEIRKRMVN